MSLEMKFAPFLLPLAIQTVNFLLPLQSCCLLWLSEQVQFYSSLNKSVIRLATPVH